MKSMYLNQALGQASEAIGRLENLVAYEHLTVVKRIHKRANSVFSSKRFLQSSGANQKAVDDISFTITQARTVALVGARRRETTLLSLVPAWGNRREGF